MELYISFSLIFSTNQVESLIYFWPIEGAGSKKKTLVFKLEYAASGNIIITTAGTIMIHHQWA